MGCKCTNEERNSEVLSLDVNMAYNKAIPNGKCIEHFPNENKSLFEENNFGTTSKFNSANNNEDSATTAKSQNDLDRRILCEAIFKEINSARVNPKEYIKKVKKYKTKIYNENNQFYFKISENSSIKLRSGQEAFDNCISFLERQEPLKPLNFVDCVKLDDFSYFINNCISGIIPCFYIPTGFFVNFFKSFFDFFIINYAIFKHFRLFEHRNYATGQTASYHATKQCWNRRWSTCHFIMSGWSESVSF